MTNHKDLQKILIKITSLKLVNTVTSIPLIVIYPNENQYINKDKL